MFKGNDMKKRNLKGYTKSQRELAYSIRDRVTNKLDLSKADDCNLYDRIMKISSPIFFIRYQKRLESGDVHGSLSQYNDDNYHRRARFASGG